VNDESHLPTPPPPEGTGQLVIYRTEDGQTRINVRLIQESVWLTLNEIADLFQRDKSVISKHIKNIFETGELHPDRTVAKFATVQTKGGRSVTREIEFYRLEVILAVGYRVKSPRGTQFRQWATAQLQQYLVKGFALDDERLKRAAGGSYFDELLARIRDIRSSELLPAVETLHPYPEVRYGVQTSKVRTVCVRSARTDLCGGAGNRHPPASLRRIIAAWGPPQAGGSSQGLSLGLSNSIKYCG